MENYIYLLFSKEKARVCDCKDWKYATGSLERKSGTKGAFKGKNKVLRKRLNLDEPLGRCSEINTALTPPGGDADLEERTW